MNLTGEQQTILDHIKVNDGVTAVSAVAGSGKTSLLVEIAKAFPKGQALYLAYNKSIATEASRKFPSSVSCMTTHSLAYRAIVSPSGLSVTNFINFNDAKDIKSFDYFVEIANYIKDFCLSEYSTLTSFFETKSLTPLDKTMIEKYISKMAHGEIPCTHEAYLKFYHMSLANGTIQYAEPFTLIMLDEAGDLNPVTLEIFKLLPANRKIMVGDPHQNIYAFNQTINGFEAMSHKVTKFPMSQSFRVASDIAKRVEKFCIKHLKEDFSFKGTNLSDKTITSRAYITRTNAALVAKMIELNRQGIQYGLIRTPEKIFELPRMLCALKPNGVITDKNYAHLQKDINSWDTDAFLKKQFKSPLAYIKNIYKEDVALQVATTLVLQYGVKGIYDCFAEAKKHKLREQTLTLGTAHSCKGLEFDSVTIAPDLNTVAKAAKLTGNKDELNLYYVATTRARKELLDADELDSIKCSKESKYESGISSIIVEEYMRQENAAILAELEEIERNETR